MVPGRVQKGKNMEEQAIIRQEEQSLGISAATFGNVFTTANLESVSGKNAVLRALNDAESLAESVPDGSTLEVTDFVVTPGVRRSRMAGVPDAECLNVYIITRDGRAFMTQSDGIARSVQQIMGLYSVNGQPVSPRKLEGGCLRLMVKSRKLANGNTLKTLVPID